MAQHLDRLSAIDAGFLAQEGPNAHMHIGAVVRCEGPAPPFDALLDHIRGRLHLVPRYRQRLALPPLDAGRPVWADDPAFDVAYHVRRTRPAPPGDQGRLLELVGDLMAEPLDRGRPLWELWVVEGLDDGGFALVSKTHHSVIDGIAGVDLAGVLFDPTPTPAAVPHPGRPWVPRPEPSAARLYADATLEMARTAAGAVGATLGAMARPRRALRAAGQAAGGFGEVVRAALSPAPATPLNVPIGPLRRLAMVDRPLGDLKLVKHAFGGTVNDVVLTAVSGGLRRWLADRGAETEGLELRALVPVSTRTEDHRGTLGNRLTVMRAPLPVSIPDPIARLHAVKAAMDGLKES
jgi:WS/DGAT/MGAT family acyltransferase